MSKKEIYLKDEISAKLIQYVKTEGMTISKARKRLLEDYASVDIPSVGDLGLYLRNLEEEKSELTIGLEEKEERADILKRVGSSLLAIKDLDCLGILSDAIETNKKLMEQAIHENNVQIYSAKDFIALQQNQLKLIDSYVNLMMNSQKYALEERKIQEAEDNGVSISDADIKATLLELLQNNSGIIDSIDIPSLREELGE